MPRGRKQAGTPPENKNNNKKAKKKAGPVAKRKAPSSKRPTNNKKKNKKNPTAFRPVAVGQKGQPPASSVAVCSTPVIARMSASPVHVQSTSPVDDLSPVPDTAPKKRLERGNYVCGPFGAQLEEGGHARRFGRIEASAEKAHAWHVRWNDGSSSKDTHPKGIHVSKLSLGTEPPMSPTPGADKNTRMRKVAFLCIMTIATAMLFQKEAFA